MTDTITITIRINELEPGTHIARKTTREITRQEVVLPLAECQEIRPDWGVYRPITTNPAIERALTRRGYFTPLPENQQYFFGVKKESA